jgi:kynurenine formamidase
MAVKIIDLSDTLQNGTTEPLYHKIIYRDHEEGGRQAAELFGLKVTDFPEGKAWSLEEIELCTHSGTHVDAPYHFWPESEGKPARTIDTIPLGWCYGDGVVLDFSHRRAGDLLTAEDIQESLLKIKYTLKPLDIVLIRTDVWKRFGEPGYQNLHPGMSEEATLWLVEQGIKMMGIDAWGWDRPFTVMAEEYKAGVKGRLWAAHFAGAKKEYCHIEKLTNLDKLPPYGFKVACFPVKIKNASAGWTRAVAILEE